MNALVRQMTQLFKDYVKISRNVPNETIAAFDNVKNRTESFLRSRKH
jgi:hypothetical protein